MSRPLDLACAADEGYLAHSAAMLHSVLVNGGEGIVVHYLHGSRFPERAKRALAGMFDAHSSAIHFHEIRDRQLRGLPIDRRFGPAMWYRVFLPELLGDIERVLYLDVDTMVMRPLAALWELSLEGYLLAAVRNVFMKYHRWRAPELGVRIEAYFNSGVLLFNLDQMRKARFTRKILHLVRRMGAALEWPDQDALNLVVESKWLSLHPRWNVMNSYLSNPDLAAEVFGEDELRQAVSEPAIRHFEGPDENKPWHPHHVRGGRELYLRHRRGTPWPEVTLEKSPP